MYADTKQYNIVDKDRLIRLLASLPQRPQAELPAMTAREERNVARIAREYGRKLAAEPAQPHIYKGNSKAYATQSVDLHAGYGATTRRKPSSDWFYCRTDR